MSLDERVRFYVEFPVRKHHTDGYPERDIREISDERIDAMSNTEFLSALDLALSEVLEGLEVSIRRDLTVD